MIIKLKFMIMKKHYKFRNLHKIGLLLCIMMMFFGSLKAQECFSIGSSTDDSCLPGCDGSATASIIDGVAPFTYSWATGETTESIYNLCAGVYACTVLDANGCWSGFSVIIDNTTLSAYYTYSKEKVKGKITYHFTDGSSGPVTAWFWDFGDGSTSSLQNPDHQFSADGSYNVCLTASADSCGDTYCETIEVGGSKGGGKKPKSMIGGYNEVGDIYPNPVIREAYIDINIESHSKIDVMVFNEMGQRILSQNEINISDQRISLQLADLPNGIYIARVSIDNNEPVIKKFIK